MQNSSNSFENQSTKFCQYCGAAVPVDAVVCTSCGRQLAEFKQQQQPNAMPNIIITNTNTNTNVNRNTNVAGGVRMRPKNKWVAFMLCLFLGIFGAHKFYEGKAGMGILYIFTVGLFGIGVIVDLIAILLKPNHYFV